MTQRNNVLPSLVPGIYHQSQLPPFLSVGDDHFLEVEQKIETLPSLTNVDTCPEKFLPYLARLTHVPLWGDNPVSWRKQIRNWPYICRLKGTKKAISYFMDAVGSLQHQVPTYWRNDQGQYVVSEPTGEPFYHEESGLWRNSKTHYFGIQMSLDEDQYLWDGELKVVQELVKKWIRFVKPFHAELLFFAWTLSLADNLEASDEAISFNIDWKPQLLDVYQWDRSHYGDGRVYGSGNKYGTGQNDELILSLGMNIYDSIGSLTAYGHEAIVGESLVVGGMLDGVDDEFEIQIYKNGVEINE